MKLKKKFFYRHKTPNFLGDVDMKKILISNKISFGGKNCNYFIGYLHNGNNVKPLHVNLPKTSAYVKSYDGEIKGMYFLIEDDDLLDKYNTVWDKVSAKIKKKFDYESVFNKELLKTKINSHVDDFTDFYDKNVRKVDSNHTCLTVMTLDSPLKKNYN